MIKRTLYNDNKALKAAGMGTLLFAFQLLIGLSTGWIIVTILFSVLLVPCIVFLIYYSLQWLKVQKMTDTEYARYIEKEKIKRGDVPKTAFPAEEEEPESKS